MKEFKLYLNGLTCANCGNKIERKVDSLKGVEEAVLNFSVGTLTIELKDENDEVTIVNNFKVNKDNYKNYNHYKYTFIKNENNNYIFEKIEKI